MKSLESQIFVFTCVLLLFTKVIGQEVSLEEVKGLKLDQITWHDTSIRQVIKQMVNEEKGVQDNYGYFVVIFSDTNYVQKEKSSSDLIYSYRINRYYYEAKDILNLNPIGFFESEGYPVVLALGRKSPLQLSYKRKEIKKINSFIKGEIPVKKKLILKNDKGEEIVMKDFSESLIRIHGSKRVNVFSDGQIEILNIKY